MATSQNGLSANDRSVIASFTIPGSSRKLALRKGPMSVVLLDFLGFWHQEIEPIDTGQLDDWGYAERLIRGSSTTLSNHSSGSAADLNALKHVLGKLASASLSPTQIAKIRARIALYKGVLRWGGDYTGRKDVMHTEGDKLARLSEMAAQIQTGWLAPGVRSYLTGSAANPQPATPGRPSAPAASSPGVLWIQDRLNGLGFGPLTRDGIPGPRTVQAVKAFQFAAGLAVDGDFGPLTREASDRVPAYPGNGIRPFQQRLKDRGWTIGVDGIAGPQTSMIMRKFQAEKGLTVDGKPGPQTWTALWTRGT